MFKDSEKNQIARTSVIIGQAIERMFARMFARNVLIGISITVMVYLIGFPIAIAFVFGNFRLSIAVAVFISYLSVNFQHYSFFGGI